MGDYTHNHPHTMSKSFGGCLTVDSSFYCGLLFCCPSETICSPTSKTTLHCEVEVVVYGELSSMWDCKKFSTQIVFLGQQKSSPQLPIFNSPNQISQARKQARLHLDPMFIVNEGPSIGPLAQPKAVKQLNKLQSGQLKQLWKEEKVSIMKLVPRV